MPNTEGPEILTSEAARILEVSAATIRNFVARGLLHCYRVNNGTAGGIRVFQRDEVEALATHRAAEQYAKKRRTSRDDDRED